MKCKRDRSTIIQGSAGEWKAEEDMIQFTMCIYLTSHFVTYTYSKHSPVQINHDAASSFQSAEYVLLVVGGCNRLTD